MIAVGKSTGSQHPSLVRAQLTQTQHGIGVAIVELCLSNICLVLKLNKRLDSSSRLSVCE